MKWKQGLPTYTPEPLWVYSWFHQLLKILFHNWTPLSTESLDPPLASYKVSVHLAKRFQKRRFLDIDQSETCQPCLLIDWDEIWSLYRGPSIDASYQVLVNFAKRFHGKRLKCEKLADDGRRTPSDGKSLHGLWLGKLKMIPSE